MQPFDASDDISSRSSFEHRRIRGRQFSVELKSGQRMERLSVVETLETEVLLKRESGQGLRLEYREIHSVDP
jgi:hypothetical protein